MLDEHCDGDRTATRRDHQHGERRLAFKEEELVRPVRRAAEYVAPARSRAAPSRWSTGSAEYLDAGAEWAILAIRAPFDTDGLDRFAAEVLPALQD